MSTTSKNKENQSTLQKLVTKIMRFIRCYKSLMLAPLAYKSKIQKLTKWCLKNEKLS